ncbi:alpha/beta hydrolase [Shewanella donghaensis]|uniref:alpha/beta hydrolase n=1 Tax=Shewanella donghaensis TaxID=238836 RepID=UPI001182991B|nr:alpha/beta hydrolase-fold protein [Shewanella donghaensis]
MAIKRIEVSSPDYTAAHVTMLTVHSSHLNGRHDISVYHHCDNNDDITNLPMIILLHGVYGSHWAWMQLGGAHKVYDQLKSEGLSDFVLVMPSDGGLWDGSGYLPHVEQGNFEAWITDDVINAVRDNISNVNEQSHIYISGLSMGGYGALRLGAKYPRLFSGISAHSSVTSLDDLQQFIDGDINQYQTAFTHESDLSYWFAVNKHQIPPLRFDCGVDDSLFKSNQLLTKQFDDLKITYQFEAFDGGHEWAYWHKHVAKTFTFFDQLEKQKVKNLITK